MKPVNSATPQPPPTTSTNRPRNAAASGTLTDGGMTSRMGSLGWSWWTPWMIQCSRAPRPSCGSKWKTSRCSQYSVSVQTT